MQDLINLLIQAKVEESRLKEVRLKLEDEIAKRIGNQKLEGTASQETETHKVTVSNKLTRSLDLDAYLDIRESLPLEFVDFKPSINLKNLRHIEAIDPDIVARCVTVKPAKPTINVKEL